MTRIRMFALAALTLLAAAAPASAGDVRGCCPLPEEFSFIIDGETKQNSSAQSQSGESLDLTLHQEKIDADSGFLAAEPHHNTEENKESEYKFHLENDIAAQEWKKDSYDSEASAVSETDDWSPKEDKGHKKDEDNSIYSQKQCWDFVKAQSKWTGNHRWKINEAAFAYHFDCPTVWGKVGGIGNNDEVGDEGYGGGEGKDPGTWKYVVPSAPLFYFTTGAMTAMWEWDFDKNVHHYQANGQHKCTCTSMYRCNMCHICGLPESLKQADWDQWDPSIRGKTFSPNDIYGGAVEVPPPEPSDTKTYDKNGVSASSIYDNGKPFALTGIATMIARSSVLVHDMKPIAHIGFGENVWGSEGEGGPGGGKDVLNGKKISECDEHEVKFELFDNDPHMTLFPESIGVKKTADGEYDNEAFFRAIFWYEDVVYDYLGASNPALGLKEVFYAPKFVLKRGQTWKSLADFVKSADGAKAMAGGSAAETNPTYVKFTLSFSTKDLFDGQAGDKEDTTAFHYAKTALGDQFGGPRWEDGAYDGEAYDSYEGLAKKFKNIPVNFSEGRGALKCFFEVHQSDSKDENAYGAGHPSFDCADHPEPPAKLKSNKYFFHDLIKGASTYQEQVLQNPKHVQFLTTPKDANEGKYVCNGTGVNPKDKLGEYVPVPKYEDKGDEWTAGCTKLGKPHECDKFQAYGRIYLTDKSRPGVGLRVYNKSSQKYRDIYYKNSIDKLEFYEGLRGSGQKEMLRNDEEGGTEQYTDDAEEWKFEGTPKELGQGEDEFTPPDKGQGYGLFEDVELEMSHNDLKSNEKHGSVLCFYAHDNIDGQRMKYTMQVPKDYFYKGVQCEGNDREKYPSSAMGDAYANDRIGEGYKSWLVFDNSFSEPKMLEKYRPDGNNFIYPNITFNNPNVKADGSELNAGASDIHVYYLVRDKAGNTRKFRLKFFVKAIDVNINTLERQDQKQ